MDSKKIGTREKESVQSPEKEKKATTFVRTSGRTERPLEERRVVKRQENTIKPTEKQPERELDWALSPKRMGGENKEVMPSEQNMAESGKGKRQLTKSEERLRNFGRIAQWFQILCFMHIPVFGFFYMLVTALRKKTPPQKKSFAAAYILYRILVLFLAGTILFIIYKVGLGFVEEILRYARSYVLSLYV